MASFSFFLVSYWRCWCCNKKKSERKPSQILADGDGETAIERERERVREKRAFYALLALSCFTSFTSMNCMPRRHVSFFSLLSSSFSVVLNTSRLLCTRLFIRERARARVCIYVHPFFMIARHLLLPSRSTRLLSIFFLPFACSVNCRYLLPESTLPGRQIPEYRLSV